MPSSSGCRFGDLTGCSVACDAGGPRACNNLGAMYEEGTGVARDLDRAEALYARGCDGGARAACTNKGRLAEARSIARAPPAASAAPAAPPPVASSAPADVTVSTTSTSKTIVMESEACFVNGRPVACSGVTMPNVSVFRSPDGGLTVSIRGMTVYTDP